MYNLVFATFCGVLSLVLGILALVSAVKQLKKSKMAMINSVEIQYVKLVLGIIWIFFGVLILLWLYLLDGSLPRAVLGW
ncbi:MAG: hypothetical protein ACK5LX_14040 [Oscillospiraceae bacterium]